MRALHPYRAAFLLAALVPLALTSCSDSLEPQNTAGDGAALFDGTVDPGAATFVLQRLETPVPDEAPVIVELVASDLRLNPDADEVTLAVAVRNASGRALFADAHIVIYELSDGVAVLNPDNVSLAPTPRGGAIFDYSELMGADGVLDVGETSGAKDWVFRSLGLAPFSFGAAAFFGLGTPSPHIAGRAFFDKNANGRFDADEDPIPNGNVLVLGPDGSNTEEAIGRDGRYRVAVSGPGLYQVTYRVILPAIYCPTTPNPLQVILTANPDGQVVSFDNADFGVGPCSQVRSAPVMLTERDPSDIEQDHYSLGEIALAGDILKLRVGFSGCGDEHPFTLFAGSNFMESNPVQTWVLLAHDDRGELCDAFFEKDLLFDLAPLREAHIRAYGAPGVIILRFQDFEGNIQRFEFGP